jgi:antitoxin ParD1/3/4
VRKFAKTLGVSAMATMNISLPEKLKAFVEQEVAEGDFSNVSDFMRDIIRNHQEQKNYRNYLKQSINEGLKSPVSEYLRSETLAKMRASIE